MNWHKSTPKPHRMPYNRPVTPPPPVLPPPPVPELPVQR